MVAVAAPPVDPCRRRRRRARSSPPPRPCGGFTVSSKTRSGRERLVTVALCSPFCARLLRSPSAAALGPSHHRDSRHIADRLGARVAPVAPRVVPVAPTCGPTRRFSRGDWDRDWGDWGLFQKATGLYTRATRPTLGATRGTDSRRQGRQHYTRRGECGPTDGRLASPTRPLPFGEATSPSATRPRDLRPPGPTRPLATTVRAATSCAAPSYIDFSRAQHMKRDESF